MEYEDAVANLVIPVESMSQSDLFRLSMQSGLNPGEALNRDEVRECSPSDEAVSYMEKLLEDQDAFDIAVASAEILNGWPVCNKRITEMLEKHEEADGGEVYEGSDDTPADDEWAL